VVGQHSRRYVISSQCTSTDSCRIAANTFDSSGHHLGSIVFKWDGSAYKYGGGADWYRHMGGASCQSSSGDVIADAYRTHEEVRLSPGSGSPASTMTGTKTMSGTPTAAGTAAGCQPFTMSYTVSMSTS